MAFPHINLILRGILYFGGILVRGQDNRIYPKLKSSSMWLKAIYAKLNSAGQQFPFGLFGVAAQLHRGCREFKSPLLRSGHFVRVASHCHAY